MITLIFSPINLSVSSIDDEDEDDMLGLAKGRRAKQDARGVKSLNAERLGRRNRVVTKKGDLKRERLLVRQRLSFCSTLMVVVRDKKRATYDDAEGY